MLFAESDAPHLKAWIVRRLANTSDADADVLADYVLALLRHDDSTENIRQIFNEEIPDFLRDDAAAFTDDVFQALKYKSYLPGAPPAPPVVRQPPPQVPTQPPPRPDAQYQPQAPFVHNTSFPPFGPGASRKRTYNDRDDNDVDIILDDRDAYNPALPYKQARRGSRDFAPRGGRFDNGYGIRDQRGGPTAYPAPPAATAGQFGQPPSYPSYPRTQNLPQLDHNSIMENIQRLQQLGIPIPPTPELPRPVYSGSALPPPRRRKGQCRDYDTKGYCSRGSRCLYEHGFESVYVPPFGPSPVDEYDPNNASLSFGPFGLPPQPQGIPPLDMSAPSMVPSNRRDPKKPKKPFGKGRAPIAANGPVHDRTKSTIVVQNIPKEHFTEVDLRGFFSQFGNIVEMTLQEESNLAIIKFDSWEAANAAWSSPKVIFDNRFVKVFWYKDEAEAGQGLKGKMANRAKNGVGNGDASANETAEPEFDMDEFLRKQEEAQKIHEEKAQKRQEIEKQRQELEQRQKELLARQQEEKRKLQAKLTAKTAAKDPSSSSPADIETSNTDKKPSTQAEALRAQLARLEEEANSLGIDPNDVQDDSYPWGMRGRGRGRRPYRGRGGFPPRASRGGYGYRGRGGAESRHAAYAAYSLDLRPKIIAITGADFTVPEKEEVLRQYLFGVGEFKEIHIDPAATHITFKDRKTAEQFMFGVTAASNNQIPGIDEKLELAWASSAPTAESTAAGEGPGDGDALMASGLEDAAKEKASVADNHVAADMEDGEVYDGGERDEGDMDYEGIF
ncbi:hypothetical protein DL766_003094 [Monosporascus sp. MC13-8B]|uniref:C3H1-type domain-containing protein n=1 Tax=Monosporascus cannonballus TaxID=155416 RepID=A0ABY0HA21_9PEZI|nr:hypothetical protein DL763_006701 [Monosporascus cannonballus]RYO88629.1 hypothetical protein DL762_003665 [Monosporascus cannonballus]RYP34193.1 hypothetical protein DL766_003094 [Monosporascus sp. MC13-8B]